MLRVLLVGNPQAVSGWDRLIKMPSLNLASIAANVNREACEVRIADLVVRNAHPQRALVEELDRFRPHLVGLTAMSFQYETALALAMTVRDHNRETRIAIGGYHVSADRENILRSDDMQLLDYLIEGEGETAFRELTDAIVDGRDLNTVRGLSYLRDGEPVSNPRPPLADLGDIRVPDRGARVYKRGFHIFGVRGDVIETSRGCVYNCNFCSIRQMYGRLFRKYSIDRVLSDLKDAKRHGARFIFIADDNITVDVARYLELCKRIIGEKLSLSFAVQASVRGINSDPELVRLMAEAGTKYVFLGIENESNEALRAMHKSDQLESSNTFDAVNELHQHGIVVAGGFIFGYPDDTEETLMQNFNYAKQLRVELPAFNILTPHLKTEIREDLLDQNLVTNASDYSKYDHYHANVRTKHLSDSDLFRIGNEMVARFFTESGAVFRLIRARPLFFIRLVWRMLCNEPGSLWVFVSGNSKYLSSASRGSCEMDRTGSH